MFRAKVRKVWDDMHNYFEAVGAPDIYGDTPAKDNGWTDDVSGEPVPIALNSFWSVGFGNIVVCAKCGTPS